MNYLMDLCKNSILQTALISWFAAQLIKVIIVLIIERRVDFTRITGSGGMPSSHSSFTVSLAAAIGFTDGFDSVAFALAAAFSLVVIKAQRGTAGGDTQQDRRKARQGGAFRNGQEAQGALGAHAYGGSCRRSARAYNSHNTVCIKILE